MTQEEKNRFDELVSKGWSNLTEKEKDEYSELTKKSDSTTDSKDEPPKEKGPETVEVKKSELEGIMARLNELESAKEQREEGLHDGKWKKVDDKQGVRTATLRCLDGKYAVDLYHERDEFNTKTQEKDVFYKIKWLLPDNEYEETEMLLKDFVQNVPRQEVSIDDLKKEKLKQVVKKTRRVEVDYAKYRSKPGDIVDMTVVRDRLTYQVTLPDGRKFRLDASKLNM